MQITIDVINHVQDLIDNGQSFKEAVADVGVSGIGLRSACERLVVDVPKAPTLLDKLQPHLDDYQHGRTSQTKLAALLGVSQGAVSNALRLAELNDLKSLRAKEECKRVLNHIREHGGYVPSAVKALGIGLHPQIIRQYAKDVGFDLQEYQFAHERHGLWLTLPGPFTHTIGTTCYAVPAVCLGCGTKYENVSLANLRSGKSRSCMNCHNQAERVHLCVVSHRDGTRFRSIRDWCRQLGLDDQYQKMRIKLKKNGEVTINGDTYYLEDSTARI